MEEELWIEDGDDNKKSDSDAEEEDAECNDLFADNRGEFQLTFNRDITVCLTGIKAKYPMFLQSTGMTLWESSKNLCTFLCENPDVVKDKSVIELGAGLGLAGIVAHKLGAKKVLVSIL